MRTVLWVQRDATIEGNFCDILCRIIHLKDGALPLLAISVGILFDWNEQGKISTLERGRALEYEVEEGGGEDANNTTDGESSSINNENEVE